MCIVSKVSEIQNSEKVFYVCFGYSLMCIGQKSVNFSEFQNS